MLKPISEIKINLGIEPNGRVERMFTDTCDKHMDKYIPADQYNLRNNKSKTANSITYQSPYAHYQYKGMREDGTHVVRNYTTPRNWIILG